MNQETKPVMTEAQFTARMSSMEASFIASPPTVGNVLGGAAHLNVGLFGKILQNKHDAEASKQMKPRRIIGEVEAEMVSKLWLNSPHHANENIDTEASKLGGLTGDALYQAMIESQPAAIALQEANNPQP